MNTYEGNNASTGRKIRLAIVTTHPIQYNAPWFKLLSEKEIIDLHVFYTWEQSQNKSKYDPDFQKEIEWDIPLLEGYEYSFVKNISTKPGSNHFRGIVNPTLNKEIEDWKADAVLIFGWAFKSHLQCMKYFNRKTPVLFRGDSTLLDERSGIKKIIRRIFLRYVYSFIDYALYVGKNNKDYFIAHGISEDKLVFVPHAVDNERFSGKNDLEKSAQKKEQLGFSKDDIIVLFAGKLIPKKNPEFILDVAKKVKNSRVKFLIVGNGELEEQLKSSAEGLRVKFLDFQNQQAMPVIYHLADFFVLPSRGPNETWGLSMNEALACNCKIISTTKVGGAVDIIKNYENGIVIEPGDVDKAVKYISECVEKNNYKNTPEVNSAILQTFSFNNIVERLYRLLIKIGKV